VATQAAGNRSKLVEIGPKTVKALPDPIRRKEAHSTQEMRRCAGNLLDENNFLHRVARSVKTGTNQTGHSLASSGWLTVILCI